MEKLTIIKIGGNVIDNSEKLHQFLLDFTALPGLKILVHGGGKAATDMSISMGLEPKMRDGRRVTDIDTLRLVTMVYAGLINKNIVAQLQAKGCNSIGLTGADANLITAVKRPITTVDYGFVGDLYDQSVDSNTLRVFLEAGTVPVFSAITHDGATQLLNTNADTIASALATAMSEYYETHLAYCFEKSGVMLDVDDESSLLSEIDLQTFNSLREDGVISAGMIPKLQNAFDAISKGVSAVYIGKADQLSELNSGSFGTKIMR